jgi:two-component system, NtrC family, sensor histidine kinase PilS
MATRGRLFTLIAVRLVLSTVLLGSAIFVQISRPGTFPIDPFFFLIGLTYALSVVYLATLRFAVRHPWVIDAQLACDAILVSAFIAVTGGITSYFSSLYLLAIIAASTVRGRRGAVQVAVLSTLLYLGLVTAQYLVAADLLAVEWLFPRGSFALPSTRFAEYTVTINVIGFFAVALLSGSLAEGLRTADANLERASTQMADLRAFNEYVVDSLLSGLVTTDAAGRVLTFNRAATSITGIAADHAIGSDIGTLLQLGDGFKAKLGKLAETRSFRLDTPYRRPDRRTIEIGSTVSNLALPDGHLGLLLTFQDVTDLRRLEHNSRLQQRLAAVGEMAAGIAHEIRNPLAAMSGSMQVLRQELPLSEEQAQLMDIVLRESERLNGTISSFLAYARPQRFIVTRLDVRSILQDTALLIRNGADVTERHVVVVEVPDTPVWFDADENQLRQILWNLATNGLRAMSSGGRLRLAVGYDTRRDGMTDLVLTVQDEGRGIPAEEMEAIFQPFRSSFENGTGLGLAIVHRIVTDYEGTIHVASVVGQGTTMRIVMPLGVGQGFGPDDSGSPEGLPNGVVTAL